ncbi:MOSC domain-containing protein [Bremerella sp. JC817]|uniref:MOSC domain-containing protein n=1 Tax=Bremerella sp. JC817 TaxID=3231756 RepID=UPI003457AE77
MKISEGHVVAVCLSSGGIPRLPVESAELTPYGFVGDGHRYDEHFAPKRAVTLFNFEILQRFEPATEPFLAGSVGENLSVEGIDLATLEVGDMLMVGTAEIRLEKRWKPCHAKDAKTGRTQPNVNEHLGFFASVQRAATVRPGNRIQRISRAEG